MKNTFILAVFSLFLITANGQYNCPTTAGEFSGSKAGGCTQSSSIPGDYYRRYEYYKDIFNARNAMIIPIDIYVWQDDNGEKNYLDNSTNRLYLDTIITVLNRYYKENPTPSFQPIPGLVNYDSTKIQFQLKNIYFEQNTTCWSTGTSPTYESGVLLNGIADGLHPEGAGNFKIHITGMKVQGYSGYATFPSSDFSHQHFIVTKNASYDSITNTWLHSQYINPDGVWGFAGHLAHEFGHNFDLYHTYDGGCNEASADYLDDVFGSSLNGTKKCPQDAGWGCNVYDPGNSCTNNIMGGTSSAGYFSPKQVQRMHRALTLLSIRRYAVAHHFDNNRYLEVSSNTTWDFSRKMYTNLRVKSGATLTIQCEVQFVPEAKIIIEPGGKLILDGGKLTNEDYYNDFWKGIEVWGTSSQPQYPTTAPTHQGMLMIKNGGTIENAHLGAANWKVDDWGSIGGVIQSTDGVFKNNRRDVVFMSYKNFSPTNPSIKRPNISFFTNTEFTTNDNFIEKGLAIQQHVSLWEVDGINFTNCHFSNQITTNKNNSSAPNRGIYSIDAGYRVSARCTEMSIPIGQTCPSSSLLRSSFSGFSTAIEATGAATSETVTIQQTDFINNVQGIVIDEFDNVSVNRNNIAIGNAGYTLFWPIGMGVTLANSTGYIVEENSVSTSLTGGVYLGIGVNNGGTEDNRIYKNELTGLTYGVTGHGVNHNANYQKGLQFLCNHFSNNQTAIDIGSSTTTDGVRFYQGDLSPDKSAGNTFVGNTKDITNSANSIVYFYKGTNAQPLNYSGLVTLNSSTNTNYCPSSYGGGIIMRSAPFVTDSLSTALEHLTRTYNDLNYAYQSLIDNGNTEQFKTDIDVNWSHDAWLLRSKLLQNSPYLSSEALLKTAEQNILPNGMLLEILLINPEATRGEGFVEKLQNSTNHSFPDYMLDYVRNNRDRITVRTDVEGQLSAIHSELSKTRDLIQYRMKSQEEYTYEDRLSAAKMGTEIYHKIGLMDFHISESEFDKAAAILETVRNEKRFTEHAGLIDNYADYLSFRSNLGTRNLAQLEAPEIAYLQTLAENDDRVGGYAQNILCFFYEICSEKKMPVEMQRIASTTIQNTVAPELNTILYDVTIYPNPANDYSRIQWEIYDELQHAHYRVFDLNGREMLSGKIDRNQGEATIDTKQLNNGVYIIGIYNSDQLKTNKKLVVSDSE